MKTAVIEFTACLKAITHSIAILGAMALIGWLESLALAHNIDGVAFSLSIAAISGLGGYQVKNIKEFVRNIQSKQSGQTAPTAQSRSK